MSVYEFDRAASAADAVQQQGAAHPAVVDLVDEPAQVSQIPAGVAGVDPDGVPERQRDVGARRHESHAMHPRDLPSVGPHRTEAQAQSSWN
ncbi:hypothetical protein [Saccharothrix sp. ALI-22-I]|uniref:hypothetical protein n=1 Tax=Saccharothrix sp. ALI-22-I TaxID=1933778 RepID=UPI001EE73864|nr:hypothetical protein [Saccharothrix sp. ALI-22-I]